MKHLQYHYFRIAQCRQAHDSDWPSLTLCEDVLAMEAIGSSQGSPGEHERQRLTGLLEREALEEIVGTGPNLSSVFGGPV